jgi:hypothetical protein
MSVNPILAVAALNNLRTKWELTPVKTKKTLAVPKNGNDPIKEAGTAPQPDDKKQ